MQSPASRAVSAVVCTASRYLLTVSCPPCRFSFFLLPLNLHADRRHAVVSPPRLLHFEGRIDVPHFSLHCWHWPKQDSWNQSSASLGKRSPGSFSADRHKADILHTCAYRTQVLILLTETMYLFTAPCQVMGALDGYDNTDRLPAPQGNPIQHGAMLAGIPRIGDLPSLTCDARGQHSS